jgi:hypothetical protein
MFEIRKHLIANKVWLQATIIKSYPELKSDLETFCILQENSEEPDNKVWLQMVIKSRFKSASEKTVPQQVWQHFKDLSWNAPEKREVVYMCQRLVAFFHSFIFTNSDVSQLEMLVDRMHLWQTIRAFSTAITILSFEFIILFWLSIFSFSSQELLQQIGIAVLLTLIAIAIVARYARYIINRSFSRVCMTLFSLVYFVAKKSSQEDNSTNF